MYGGRYDEVRPFLKSAILASTCNDQKLNWYEYDLVRDNTFFKSTRPCQYEVVLVRVRSRRPDKRSSSIWRSMMYGIYSVTKR